MTQLNILSCLLLLTLASVSNGARILALLPYNARSHFVVVEPLLLELNARGHHITVVSSFPQKKPLDNFRDIDLSSELPSAINNYSLSDIKERMDNLFQSAIYITEINMNVCTRVMRDNRVLNLMNEKFDLIIGEIFGADCYNYFAYKMKTPYISWVTSKNLPWDADRVGLPDNPSYIPNYFVDFPPNMTFPQRMFNTFTLLYAKAVYYYFSELPSHRLAEEVFKEKLPSMDEVNRMTSLVLVNSHFTLTQSRPFPPNVVEVGGIHIKPVQPLPKDLKDILDKSTDGAVLFSLGSLIRVSSLPPAVLKMLLSAFGNLKQRVIFKYEKPIPDSPSNVIVRNWIPQADIVAHPNVVAVVTHGGLASTIEAVYYAKPVVGIPFFSDQFGNIKLLVRRGAATMLDIDHISEQAISEALKAVIEDASYTENMKRLSQQFRDRPMTALQTAVFWTEYVIRHQGAPHLRPASVQIPFYQYLLLDVMAVLVAALVTLVWMLLIIFRLFVCTAKNSIQKPQKTKKSKKIN